MNLVESNIDTKKLDIIKLEDKSRIDRLLSISPSNGCENCFTNLFVWADVYGLEILDLDADSAVVYNRRDKYIYFPIGKIPSPRELFEIHKAFSNAGLIGENSRIYNTPPDYPQRFPEANNFFDFDANPSEADYMYEVDRQIALSGAKLRKKRNHIKHFTTQNPNMFVEPIFVGNFAKAVKFMDAEDEKKCLFAEEVAIDCAFANFDKLGLYGRILYADIDRIAAVAVIGKINNDSHSVHFEKSDKLIEGASQAIVKCEAEAIKTAGGKYMNREQDLGDENLRRAKESLDPAFMYARLGATPKNGI